jgi:DNA-binding NtrC family response regulator
MADRRLKVIEGVDRPYRKALLDFQRKWWAECLERNGGRVAAAASEAGENRSVVHKMLISLGMSVDTRHVGNWGDLTD